VTTHDPNDLRDPRFDAAWRAASREEPPAALDDAILAAARREVRAGPQSAKENAAAVPSALRPERWWAPLAAAATIGAIAIGLLQLANPDKVNVAESDKKVVSDMPAATEKAKELAERAPEQVAPKNAPAPAAAPASSIAPSPPVRQGPPVGGDARNRTMATPPVGAPAPVPALRKDAAAASTERAALSAAESAPPAGASGGRQAGVMDASKPAAPFAEPFPADGVKRETKQAPATAPPPPASMPAESGAAGMTGGKLMAQEPAKRNESMRDAQSAAAPAAPAVAPAPPPPPLAAPNLQESESARRAQQKTTANATVDAASDVRAKVQPKLPVPDWIALIRKLRDENKLDEAAKELAAFRSAHPDHERLLPPDLRDWKPAAR
jgi:hypothetical protein